MLYNALELGERVEILLYCVIIGEGGTWVSVI